MCKKLLLVLAIFNSILTLEVFAAESAEWSAMTKPLLIEKIFNGLNSQSMDLVYKFYDPDVVFEDPVGSHKGIESVKKYYENLYKNVENIRFDFSSHICEANQCVSMWTMHLKAKNLNGGEPIAVIGNSFFKFGEDGKVLYHRDYFDMGEFIYERVPVLKNIINFIKNKLKG